MIKKQLDDTVMAQPQNAMTYRTTPPKPPGHIKPPYYCLHHPPVTDGTAHAWDTTTRRTSTNSWTWNRHRRRCTQMSLRPFTMLHPRHCAQLLHPTRGLDSAFSQQRTTSQPTTERRNGLYKPLLFSSPPFSIIHHSPLY